MAGAAPMVEERRVSLSRRAGRWVLITISILFLGLLAALAAAGFQVGQLTLVFGALGVGIGIGLQDVVRNFVSGLILMFERPIQRGDTVEVAGMEGTVREIGLRATIVTTLRPLMRAVCQFKISSAA